MNLLLQNFQIILELVLLKYVSNLIEFGMLKMKKLLCLIKFSFTVYITFVVGAFYMLVINNFLCVHKNFVDIFVVNLYGTF